MTEPQTPQPVEEEGRAGSRIPLSWNSDVVLLSDTAQALFVRLMSDSAVRLSDGRIPPLVMAQQTVHLTRKATKAAIDELVAVRWIERFSDGWFYILTWKKHNLSKDRVESLIASRKAVSIAGGKARAETAKRGSGGKFLSTHPADEPAVAPAVRLEVVQPEDQPETRPVSVSVSVPVYEEEPFLEEGIQEGVVEPEVFSLWSGAVRATR